MKTFIYISMITGLILLVPSLGISQPPPPSLPLVPDQAPIDGGLSLLAAAGGAYAWKKLRHKVK